MKTKLIYSVIAAAVIMAMSGCTQESVVNSDTPTVMNASIHVSDQAFQSVDGTTRATNSGASTTFANGDAIGIFVVNKTSHEASVTNEKYTYNNNGAWRKGDGTGSATITYDANAYYFAYYPYQENLDASKYNLTATTADGFFAGLISGWTLTKDFSGTNYDAQDLMVSMAATPVVGTNTVEYSFTMNHKMALVEFQYPQTVVTDPNDATYSRATYTFLDDYKPYNLKNGCYRILVKPLTDYSFRGKEYETFSFTEKQAWSASVNLSANDYKVFKNAAGDAASYTEKNLLVGDVYFSDGTWSRNTVSGKTPIGIVVSTTSDYCENTTTGLGHGLVMALKDAASSVAWSTASTDLSANLPFVTTVKLWKGQKSGLTYTNYIKKNISGYATTYPAFNSALTYSAEIPTSGTSGWFLPSSGQWFETLANAQSYYNANSGENLAIPYSSIDETKSVYYSIGAYAVNAAVELNYLFTSKGLTDTQNYSSLHNPTNTGHAYWCSSEFSSTYACYMGFYTDGSLALGLTTKADVWTVRPFLAF